MKMPVVQVPVLLLNELCRVWKEQPELCRNPSTYRTVHLLEQRSYRKYLTWKQNERKVVK